MKKAKGYLFTIIAAVSFGFQPWLTSLVKSTGVSTLMVPVISAVFSLPVFLCIILFNRQLDFRITLRQLWKVFILALFGGALTTALLLVSYDYIDTGIGTTLGYSYPVIVMLGSVFIYHQKVKPHELVAVVLCMTGIVLFCNPGGSFSWLGFFLALGSGFTYAVYFLYLEHCHIIDEIGFVKFNFYFLLLMPVMMGAMAMATNTFRFEITPQVIAYSALFELVSGVFGMLFLQVGIKTIGSRDASILNALEPLTSIIAGAVLLHEVLTVSSVLGAVCVIASTIVLILGDISTSE